MPYFNFFEPEEPDGEAHFQQKLMKAIALISENNSIIASEVLKILKSNTLAIHSFFALSPQHYMEIMNDLSQEDIYLSKDYPPTAKDVDRIGQKLDGIIFNNKTIYINLNRSIDDIAKTLIHEVSHFINTPILKTESRTEGVTKARYNDELRSFIAERVFDRDGSCLLRSDVRKIHARVTISYPEFSATLEEQPQGYLFSTYDNPRP